jgi:hypothetical protein
MEIKFSVPDLKWITLHSVATGADAICEIHRAMGPLQLAGKSLFDREGFWRLLRYAHVYV